jgi:hypothetical protein
MSSSTKAWSYKKLADSDPVWNWGWPVFFFNLEFFCIKLFFLVFLDRFDVLMSKLNFKKYIYILKHLQEKK